VNTPSSQKPVDSSHAELKELLYRRRYLVPNLVTVGNMFCGFLAVMYASTDRPRNAFFVLVLAIVLDGLDGRVARKLNATSRFGGEFDSFSDFLSFGIAPAVLMYHWVFHPHADEFGVFVAFVYALCAAGRLARFNIAEPNASLTNFQGLPSPAAAGMVLALVNLGPHFKSDFLMRGLVTVFLLGLAFLMVSNVPYLSIKKLKVTSLGMRTQLFLGVGLAGLWYRPKEGLFLLMIAYTLSGPVEWVRRSRK
jgi:CDP-diacylglycerol---serine O-phosphatidyltransferase